MPKNGHKRSATEAFASRPATFRDVVKLHRPTSAQNGPTERTVTFQDGAESHDPSRKKSVSQASRSKGASLKERSRQLLSVRQQLPIYRHADEIRQKIKHHDALVLVGETGSGKSTQVPQFLVNEPWCRKKQVAGCGTVGGCIAVTQPRRVAAISLARRVADEMGSLLGSASPASQVGYSVRFENSTSPSTRIKFLTEGMLLQEMLRDPWLKEYSAVIVDEVHERGVNVDLVLGFLKRMQDLVKRKKDARGGVQMKVLVMSATADMEKIQDFLHLGGDVINALGATNGSNPPAPDEWAGFSSDEEPRRSKPVSNVAAPSGKVVSLLVKGRQYGVTINYASAPVPDLLDAAFQQVLDIHTHSPLPGDVLVFLTGQEPVESLLSLLTSFSAGIRKDAKRAKELPQLLVLPLYAALPSNLQQRVFDPTPKFTRKIILATNIAETSITVPGIRYVIDTGKAKQRLFRPSLNLDTLLTVPVSRSSAKQRSGRAGRDAPGTAYRLYTEADFYQLAADTEPEILRCDLSQLVLNLKAHGIDDLNEFPFLTVPPPRALERAMVHLLQLSALDGATGNITALGRQMGLLPLPASLARVLLASAEPEFDCVDEIVDIVSALSVENIFLNIHHRRSPETSTASDAARSPAGRADEHDESDSEDSLAARNRRLLFRREGDHLTLLATVQAYAAENTDRRRWCEDRRISHRAMQGAMDVRKQLAGLMARHRMAHSTGSGHTNEPGKATQPQDSTTLPHRILKCILTGFHPNVARLCADGGYRTLLTNQTVAIHPSSVLFSVPSASDDKSSPKRYEGIVYNEFVYTGSKAYARNVSALEMRWVGEVLGH